MRPIHINRHVYIAFASQSFCHAGYHPCSAVDMDGIDLYPHDVDLLHSTVIKVTAPGSMYILYFPPTARGKNKPPCSRPPD